MSPLAENIKYWRTSSLAAGLIVPVSARSVLYREAIVAHAAAHRLPSVYAYRSFIKAGGLLSYGSDLIDQYRGAAGYVDRILRGEKPACVDGLRSGSRGVAQAHGR